MSHTDLDQPDLAALRAAAGDAEFAEAEVRLCSTCGYPLDAADPLAPLACDLARSLTEAGYDPRWDRHSGKDLHRGTEWREGESARAAVLYSSVSAGTGLLFDFLMERPGELVDVDTFAKLVI